VRLVIHPIIWAALTMLIRHVGRHIGDLSITIFQFYQAMTLSVYCDLGK